MKMIYGIRVQYADESWGLVPLAYESAEDRDACIVDLNEDSGYKYEPATLDWYPAQKKSW
jgi:hypothetical protein